MLKKITSASIRTWDFPTKYKLYTTNSSYKILVIKHEITQGICEKYVALCKISQLVVDKFWIWFQALYSIHSFIEINYRNSLPIPNKYVIVAKKNHFKDSNLGPLNYSECLSQLEPLRLWWFFSQQFNTKKHYG